MLAAAFGLLSVAPAFAHHSLSIYSRATSHTIEGTVQSYRWSNPHVRIAVKTIAQDGNIKQWDIESGSVSRLAMAGFTKGTLAVGEKVSVSFYPRRDGFPSGFLISVTKEDGRKFDVNRKGRPLGGTQFQY